MPNSEVLMGHDVVLRIAPAAGIKMLNGELIPKTALFKMNH